MFCVDFAYLFVFFAFGCFLGFLLGASYRQGGL